MSIKPSYILTNKYCYDFYTIIFRYLHFLLENSFQDTFFPVQSKDIDK